MPRKTHPIIIMYPVRPFSWCSSATELAVLGNQHERCTGSREVGVGVRGGVLVGDEARVQTGTRCV